MQDRIATKFTNNAARNLISSVPNGKYNNVPHKQDKLNMKIPRNESRSLSGDACAAARVTPFRNCAKMAASLYTYTSGPTKNQPLQFEQATCTARNALSNTNNCLTQTQIKSQHRWNVSAPKSDNCFCPKDTIGSLDQSWRKTTTFQRQHLPYSTTVMLRSQSLILNICPLFPE